MPAKQLCRRTMCRSQAVTATTDPPDITVPYRSSLKKFQTRWIGDWPDRFVGSVKLEKTESGVALSGTVTNGTGKDFNDVYLAYHGGNDRDDDQVIYLPKFAKNTTIDLKKDLAKFAFVGHEGTLEAEPGHDKIIRDTIGGPTKYYGTSRDQHWMGYCATHAHGSISDAGVQEPRLHHAVYPMVSLFDRLPPRWNVVNQNNDWTSDRSGNSGRVAREIALRCLHRPDRRPTGHPHQRPRPAADPDGCRRQQNRRRGNDVLSVHPADRSRRCG